MKTVTLQILAKDFENTSYYNQEDCAITRALNRTGVNAIDTGTGLKHKLSGEEVHHSKTMISDDIIEKVQRMHGIMNSIEPRDFSFDIQIPDHW